MVTKSPCEVCGEYTSRARHHDVPYELVNRQEVYERDKWMCGICNEPVDKALKFPDVMSASLDHIIPMAKGGPHSYENTQCAHFICNSIKSDRVAV
jgi:5-methylcytosine-specific restriction endonuclease McrA